MTATVLATMTFEAVSGLPEDRVVWDFAFFSGDPVAAADDLGPQITGALTAFVNNTYVGNDIAVFLSPALTRSADGVEVNLYDIGPHLDGSPHGSPVFTDNFTLDAAGGGTAGTPEPSECAAVLAFHSTDYLDVPERQGLLRPRSRRRGRIYVGPLTIGAGDTVLPANRRVVGPALKDTATAAAADLMSFPGPNPLIDITWRVWSRADATTRAIGGGYMDDAYDTVRKRGQAPTMRTTFGV